MAKQFSKVRFRAFLKKTGGPAPIAILGALSLIPTQLLAQTCEASRPNWTEADGQVTAWGEAIFVFSSPFGMVLLGILALAVLTRKDTWLAAGAIAGAGAGFLLYLVSTTGDYAYDTRLIEYDGCAGPNTIAVAICAAICLTCAGIFVIKRRLRGEHNA